MADRVESVTLPALADDPESMRDEMSAGPSAGEPAAAAAAAAGAAGEGQEHDAAGEATEVQKEAAGDQLAEALHVQPQGREEGPGDAAGGGGVQVAQQQQEEDTGELTYHAEMGAEDAGELPQHEAVAMARDVLTAASAVPRVKKTWKNRHLKLLFAGGAGLGKTTVLRNLLGAYAGDANLKVNGATGAAAGARFQADPDRFATRLVVKDRANLIHFHYTVVDTPGLAYLEGGVEPITRYLLEGQLRHHELEADRTRAGPLDTFVDPRVDAVIFFLPPHAFTQEDLEALAAIAKLAPVVPVLAKADAMTRDELVAYRGTVRKALSRASKGLQRPLAATFSEEALREAHAPPNTPPFSVIGAHEVDESVGRFWPIRVYVYGTASTYLHSDIGCLKRLLFEIGFEDLKAQTEQRFYAWRRTHMLSTDPDMPTERGTIVEHALRALTVPESGEARRLRQWLRHAGKVGLVVLVATLGRSYLRGGRAEVERDLEKLQGVGQEALSAAAEKAQAAAQAAGQAAGGAASALKEAPGALVDATKEHAPTVAEKGKQAGSFFRKKAAEVGEGVGEVREAVAHRLGQGAGEAERARVEAERQAKQKRGWNPLRLFRK